MVMEQRVSKLEGAFEQIPVQLDLLDRHLEASREENTQRFDAMQAESNRRFAEMQAETARQFAEMQAETARQFKEQNDRFEAHLEKLQAETARQFAEMQADMTRQFKEQNDKIDANNRENTRRIDQQNRMILAGMAIILSAGGLALGLGLAFG